MQKSLNLFYGWWMVIFCFIIMFITVGSVVFGFTAFINPIVQEFGWSYAQVSLAASLRGAETGLVAPLMGFLVDRWGSKWVLFGGVLFIGLGTILLGQINTLGGYYGAFVLIAVGVSCCSPTVYNAVANNWFRRNLGMVMGIFAAGSAFGGVMIPVIVKMIESFGWRHTLLYIGIASLVICLPLALLLRHKPEKYGYTTDGDPLGETSIIAKSRSKASTVEIEVSTKQALRSRTFWNLTIAAILQSTVVSGLLVHIMPFLNDINMDRSIAGYFSAAIPLISVIGRLGAGWMSDRTNRTYINIISFSVIFLGTLLFIYITNSSLWILIIAVLLFSLAYGGIITMRAVLTREYFGKKNFGTILGCTLGISALGSVLGPYLAGWIFDTWHSYHYAWILFTIMDFAAVVLVSTIPQIKMKKALETSENA